MIQEQHETAKLQARLMAEARIIPREIELASKVREAQLEGQIMIAEATMQKIKANFDASTALTGGFDKDFIIPDLGPGGVELQEDLAKQYYTSVFEQYKNTNTKATLKWDDYLRWCTQSGIRQPLNPDKVSDYILKSSGNIVQLDPPFAAATR